MSFDQDPNEQANISGADLAILIDELKEARRLLAACKEEIKSINSSLDDPRCDLTMTASELIIELKQQLTDSKATALHEVDCRDAAEEWGVRLLEEVNFNRWDTKLAIEQLRNGAWTPECLK